MGFEVGQHLLWWSFTLKYTIIILGVLLKHKANRLKFKYLLIPVRVIFVRHAGQPATFSTEYCPWMK